METPAGCTRPWADPSHGWAAVMYQEEPMENLSEVEGRKSTVKSNSARDPAGSSTRSGPHELDTTRKVSLRRSTTDELPGVHNVHNGRALANLVTRHMAEAPGPGQWPAPESNSQLLQRLESQIRRVIHQQPQTARNVDRLRRTNAAMHSHIEELIGVVAKLKQENAQLRACLQQCQQQQRQPQQHMGTYAEALVYTPPLYETADDLFGNLPFSVDTTQDPSTTIGPSHALG